MFSRILRRAALPAGRRAVPRMHYSAPAAEQSLKSADAQPDATLASVQNYYGKVLQSTKDLKTSACTTGSAPHPIIRSALAKVPSEVKDKYYGCGVALPLGIEGLNVLDLGSGSGQDCYIAASLVGEKGTVTGIDMTDEQLSVARNNIDEYTKTLGYSKPNLKFSKGFIEYIKDAGVEDGSMNLCISNCVVNLSPDKEAVLQGVYNSLSTGGEFYFSDVYCDRRLPQHVKDNEVLWGECVSGALYIEDFKRICQKVGFMDPRVLDVDTIEITDPELKDIVGEAKFYSITYRLFKLDELETLCEDYGQVATYNGTLPGSPNAYTLDDHHHFEKGRPMLVCGNTAAMVGNSWLGKHFTVQGDMNTHFGLFDCAPVAPTASAGGAAAAAAAACAPASPSGGGGCC